MNARFLIPLVALGTTACGSACCLPGLWYIKIGNVQTSDSEFDCDENFDNASCPEADGDEGEYTFTSDATESEQLIIVEILEGPSGNKILVRDGMIYPGTQDGKVWTFSWTRQETGDSTVEHESGDYEETASVDGQITETFTLERGKGNIYMGSWSLQSSVESKWTQTDEWDEDEIPDDPLEADPPLSNPFDDYLEVDEDADTDVFFVENTPDEDCSSSDCELTITQNSSASADLMGWLITNVTLEQDGDRTSNETPAGLPSSGSTF